MKNHIIIAKDGFPLERIKGKPITNIIRILLFGRGILSKKAYYRVTGIRVI